MIDNMAKTLKTEQQEDDHKKEYCGNQLDASDDSKKDLERKVADSEADAAAAKDGIATLAEEIAALQAGVKALDKSVVEATEDRKAEHEEYTELMAHNSAAKELLGYAKNRLNKFYNPKLHKAEPTGNAPALVQVSSSSRRRAPETWGGAYGKKSEQSTG